MRDYANVDYQTGGTGGTDYGPSDVPLTVVTLTPGGASMGHVDHDYGQDVPGQEDDRPRATLYRNHKHARVYRAGRP